MHGFAVSGLASAMINHMGNVASYSAEGKIAGLSLIAAVLSNVVSNVPAVMLLKPLRKHSAAAMSSGSSLP
jgi:Na+/H+ antiporter NhaD/arsenite permease-like protein